MRILYTVLFSSLFTFALSLTGNAWAQAPVSLGCFADSAKRDLDGFLFQHPDMTSVMCVSMCRSKNFAFAGTQAGKFCLCGNTYGKQGLSDKCTSPCAGKKTEICGGFWANTVYPTVKEVAGQAIGCFVDKELRDLVGPTDFSGPMTTQKCVNFCKSKDFKYAGTQAGSQCFCGNTYGSHGSSSACTTACSGNAGEKCGGTWANLVFATGAAGRTGTWLPAGPDVLAGTQFGTSAGKALYACRFQVNANEKQSGKAWNNTCYVGLGGREISRSLALSEVLVVDGGQWVRVSDGKVPDGTVLVGNLRSGPLHVCRAKVGNGEMHPGKLWNNTCYVGWMGRELAVKEYEVLLPGAAALAYAQALVAKAPPVVAVAAAPQNVEPYAPGTPENAKDKAGDNSEVTRMKRQLRLCVTQVEESKQRADHFKSAVKSGKIKGAVESKELADAYQEALNQYNAFKLNAYPPNKDSRFNGFNMDHFNDCLGASDGFRSYYQDVEIANERAFREYEAAKRQLSESEARIKPQLELCVVNLQLLQEDNNKYNEDSRKIFNTANPQLNAQTSAINGKINSFLNSNSVVYTEANLAACKKLALDTSVRDEFVRLGGLKRASVLRDMNAQKAEEAAAEAARQKKAADEAAAFKARMEAEAQARAAAEAADRDPARLRKCVDEVRARRAAIGTRFYHKENMAVATQDNWRVPFESWTREIDASISNLANSPTSRVSHCLAPWPELDQLENLVMRSEKVSAENRQKEAARKQKELDDARAKAKKEYADWLRNNPTDIPQACEKGCLARHMGPGPKQKECARMCAITSAAVKDSVNFIVDQTVIAGADKALGALGVSKAACELAASQAAAALAAGQAQIDKLAGKISDASQEACLRASGSAARCNYVGRFIKFSQDFKSCSEVAKTLNKSLQSTQTKYANQDRLVKKSKSGGVTKDEENAIKDIVMDEGLESASTCESVKASDLASAIIQPCMSASADAVWLATNVSDL